MAGAVRRDMVASWGPKSVVKRFFGSKNLQLKKLTSLKKLLNKSLQCLLKFVTSKIDAS